jgi:hypothetical protein
LAEQLCADLGWWAGPVSLPLDQLHRLAGPAGDPVLCPVPEEYWDDRVEAMDELAQKGWEPAPVIVAYRRQLARHTSSLSVHPGWWRRSRRVSCSCG